MLFHVRPKVFNFFINRSSPCFFRSPRSPFPSGDIRRTCPWRPAQDMEEQRATNPTEEKTCSINDLTVNELRLRDVDIPKVSTEHDQRL